MPNTTRLTRRTLLAAGGGVAIGALTGAGIVEAAHAGAGSDTTADPGIVPFDGDQQAGIVTPPQFALHFAAFDVTTDRVEELKRVLHDWTIAARRMAQGLPAAVLGRDQLAPPPDTGEALDLPPSNLTITIGFGPSLFELGGRDRFGIAAKRPASLRDLPGFRNDLLEPGRSGGDIAVQACADDPQVAFHAVRNLARIGRGVVVMRWSQLGFSKTSSNTDTERTPRNLMGFKDGTNNIQGDEPSALREMVWVGDEGPVWLRGGSYRVARRIRMLIEVWDRAPLVDQEATIGRVKNTGAPLGKTAERDLVALDVKDAGGVPVIPLDAHIRRASPTTVGTRLLRRGYSFTDGMDAFGQLDAGLFFISYQRDPQQFVAVQAQLAESDALNEYIKHTGSAVFACPPGVRDDGDWYGRDLFDS